MAGPPRIRSLLVLRPLSRQPDFVRLWLGLTIWSTHMIGHEITALWGLDHAQTLAIVLPATLRHRSEAKQSKLLRYAEAVWGIDAGTSEERIDRAIEMTEDFFQMLGAPTRLADYDITDEISD